MRTIEPDTTTHDFIPAETGKNDGDRTSGDCISRQVVAKFLDDWLFCLDENCHKQSASDLKMIIKDFKNLPSAQPEPEAVFEWKKEFKEYIESLDITRDEWKGIIEYIDELPSAEQDTTTHDSIPAETGGNGEDRTSGDCISRQAESNPLEKCYTCKHVCQRVTDADTLYCRCRKGCRYEEFKPKRSNNDSGRHED